MARNYDIPDLISADMSAIRRIAEIAILEALELGNSVPRVKALLSGCALLVRVREVSDMEERMIALEGALGRDKKGRAS